MPTLIAIVVGVVALSLWIHRVNTRFEAKQRALRLPTDDRVAALWDDFSDDDPAALSASLDDLLADGSVEGLRDKTAVARVAILALRAGRTDLVRACSDRLETLGPGCGEARTLAVLATACEGDMARARVMFEDSQRAIAGCAGCSASETSRILASELAMMFQGA